MTSEPSAPVRLRLRLSAAAARYLHVTVAGSEYSTANTPILTLSSKGKVVAYLNVTAAGFTPTSYSWSWVSDPLNSFSVTPTATNPFGKQGKKTKLTLTQEGIYQFVVKASDGTNSATKNVWVNVWSHSPSYNTDGSVGNNPGILPPPKVRVLSPDPGPFNHPRVLFTADDWAELSAKQNTSSHVKEALNYMQVQRGENLEGPGTAMNNLSSYFYYYAQSGYSATVYTTLTGIYKAASDALKTDTLLGKNPSTSVWDALACACYYEWLQYDATKAISGASASQQAKFAVLATTIAGASKFELEYNGPADYMITFASGSSVATFYNARFNLAFCYDVAYNWMTPAQQLIVRSYCYAIGYGKYNDSKGGLSYTVPYIASGSNQNGGDFPNILDGINIAALAIEGEESTVPVSVQQFVKVATAATTAWSGASPSSVSNLHREIRGHSEWNLTRWGFVMNMVEYFNFGENYAMLAALAFARRWEDQFVTTHIYQSCLATLYNLCLREVDASKGNAVLDLFDHHDGAGLLPGSNVVGAVYLVKYMYPSDVAVDFLYRTLRNESSAALYPLGAAIFATDYIGSTLSAMATAKGLGNFKFDPHRAVCIMRNGWLDTDFMVQFENRWDRDGHMHSEKNNFSLYALGRAWCNPPGYHVTINDCQGSILIQSSSATDKADLATAGYYGQSPSSLTQKVSPGNAPPVLGRFIEYVEDPAQTWAYCSGDAATAYTYANINGVTSTIDTGVPLISIAYPGLTGALLNEDLVNFMTGNLVVGNQAYNTILNAKRTLFTVLDSNKVHPYVLVLDDFCKDGTARNYRWVMPNCICVGSSGGRFLGANGSSTYSSLAILGTATPTQAVLYHDPIDAGTTSGLPRLLVRDVANITGNSAQPNIFIDDRVAGAATGSLTYGTDNNSGKVTYVNSRRLMIQRTAVVQPGYQILLYPFTSTSDNKLPTTSWTSSTTLTIAHVNGVTDTITFAAQVAIPASGTARTTALQSVFTKVTGFSRQIGTHSLPTITVPATSQVTCTANNAQGLPTHLCNFAISAKDATGATLAYSSNGAKGSYIPTGVQRVWVSAVDSYGQQVSTSFIALVTPSAPSVILSQAVNLAMPYSATLTWSYWSGVTGYNVKRSIKSGGPYTTIATLSAYTTTYTDSTMPAAKTYYVVTALLVNSTYNLNFESANSTQVSTAPASVGKLLGSSQVGGVIIRSSSTSSIDYLLSAKSGAIGASGTTGTLASASVSGDGVYIARCTSYTATTVYGSFGIDYRATLASNAVSAFVGFSFTATPNIYFYVRTSLTGLGVQVASVSSAVFAAAASFPYLFKLVRTGMYFTAYWAQDDANFNGTFNYLGTTRISLMPTKGHVSLTANIQATTTVKSPVVTADFDFVSFL